MSETDRGGSLSRTQKCTKGLLRFNKESIQNVHTLPTNRNLLVYELLLEWPTSVKKGFIKRETLRPLRTNSFQTTFEENIKKTFVLGPNTTLMTSIFQKKTFRGLWLNESLSLLRSKYKINLIRPLTCLWYQICSSSSLLQSTLDDLRKLVLQNGYS